MPSANESPGQSTPDELAGVPAKGDEHELMDIARLAFVGLLIVAMIVICFLFQSTIPDLQQAIDLQRYPGLSPAIAACYVYSNKLPALIIACGFGISLGVAYVFGTFLYKKFRDSSVPERQMFWGGVSSRLRQSNPTDLIEIVSGFREYEKLILERRNLYWGLFLRATLAILVVTVIALLIASCKIESQAGLPIITGIISFVIGQGADALHSSGSSILHVSGRSPINTRTDSNNSASKSE